ncbi:MAG: Smr/MutS family protein, partial [Pseudobdellovibrionaceae bacterium]
LSPPGSKVFVTSLQQDGLVQSEPNARGEVWVLANSLRLQVLWSDLKPAQKPHNPTAQLVRQSSHFSLAVVDNDRVIDLRGVSAEKAVEQLELQLDQAMNNQEERIKIIHGYGTETLKKAVRVYLSRSVYVKKWKSGGPDTGGDGITWAELSD